MYKANFRHWEDPRIEKVEVDKVTDCFVFIGGRRYNKQTSNEGYYPTWDAAYRMMEDRQNMKLFGVRVQLSYEQERLQAIKALLQDRIWRIFS